MTLFFDCTFCNHEVEFNAPNHQRKSKQLEIDCAFCDSSYHVEIYYKDGCFFGYRAVNNKDLVNKKSREWFVAKIKAYYKMTNDPMNDSHLKLIVENWDGTDEELISLFENYKPDYIAHSYQVKNMMRNDKRVTDKVKELLAKKKQSKGTKK